MNLFTPSLLLAVFLAAMMPSSYASALDRGDRVTVNHPFVCNKEIRRSWEGTYQTRSGSFSNVKPVDQSWCRVRHVQVWTARIVPLPKARPHNCP